MISLKCFYTLGSINLIRTLNNNTMSRNWKPEKWQGRSKKQVESNYKITGIIFTAFAIGFVIGILYEIGKQYGVW